MRPQNGGASLMQKRDSTRALAKAISAEPAERAQSIPTLMWPCVQVKLSYRAGATDVVIGTTFVL